MNYIDVPYEPFLVPARQATPLAGKSKITPHPQPTKPCPCETRTIALVEGWWGMSVSANTDRDSQWEMAE